MNTPLLSPTLLHAAGLFTVGVGSVMIAVHTTLLALGAQRSGLSPAARWRVPLLAAVLLAGWFAWAVLAVSEAVVTPEPAPLAGVVQRPELLLEMAGMVGVGIAVMVASPSLRAINAATPAAWPIAAQVYRVAGMMFLWPFFAGGALPAGFAWPAAVGDTLTGLAAPFVALAVARNRPGAATLAVVWNWFGILDLIVAPVSAVLSHTTNVGRFPLVIVPLFLGPPLGILTHVWSLRNLRTQRRASEVSHGGVFAANATVA